MDRVQFRKAVFDVIDELASIGYELPEMLKRRDAREPGRDEKERFEDRLMMIMRRYFNKMRSHILERIELAFPNRKDAAIPPIPIDDLINGMDDDEFMAELIRVVSFSSIGGVNLAKENITLGLDYTTINDRALSWARDYSYELIDKNRGGIDKTTRDMVSNAIQRFVDTPGFTLRDVAVQLEPAFSVDRARMIAVTETTRAFAEGQQIVADELHNQFPDVRVTKTWFTNNDDRVCDICGPVDGEEVDYDQPFSNGLNSPPAHPNCRCWTSVRTRIGG